MAACGLAACGLAGCGLQEGASEGGEAETVTVRPRVVIDGLIELGSRTGGRLFVDEVLFHAPTVQLQTRGVPATDVLASDPLDSSPLLFRYDVANADAVALAGERRWYLDGPGAGPDSQVVFGFSPLQANRAQLDELAALNGQDLSELNGYTALVHGFVALEDVGLLSILGTLPDTDGNTPGQPSALNAESGDGDGAPADSEIASGDGDGAPADSGDGDGAPADSGDGDGAPADSGDGDGAPADSGDGDGAPADSGDGDGAPADSGDGDGAPADSGDGDGAPADSGDGDGAPADSGDGDGAPADSGDGDGAPADSGVTASRSEHGGSTHFGSTHLGGVQDGLESCEQLVPFTLVIPSSMLLSIPLASIDLAGLSGDVPMDLHVDVNRLFNDDRLDNLSAEAARLLRGEIGSVVFEVDGGDTDAAFMMAADAAVIRKASESGSKTEPATSSIKVQGDSRGER